MTNPRPAVPMIHHAEVLHHDPSRVTLQLFLPGEDHPDEISRVGKVVERIIALPEDEVVEAAAQILQSFGSSVDHLSRVLLDHAATVSLHVDDVESLSRERNLVLGAAVTSEYAIEGAALCNPSAVVHPDQSGLEPGQLRIALSVRGIGEGHVSSIGFMDAVIGPEREWAFGERQMPIVSPTITEARWKRSDLIRALEHDGYRNELTNAVARALPELFDADQLEHAIRTLPREMVHHYQARRDVDSIRRTLASAYESTFSLKTHLSQRVLFPVVPEEKQGIEDARFVHVTYPDGSTGYEATYTAYDGRKIAPRLIVTPDLAHFSIHRLTGRAAKNKGVALFPRQVGGKRLALTRTDGETLFVAESEDGLNWEHTAPVHAPRLLWQIVQIGNCGSPIETERGWLVLTHGVGPMRRYCIGAILLDLDHPEKVLARLECPLIEPGGDRAPGYVPNVVYSCGGLVHDGILWLPYGVGDNRIEVVSMVVDELLDAMVPVDEAAADARDPARRL